MGWVAIIFIALIACVMLCNGHGFVYCIILSNNANRQSESGVVEVLSVMAVPSNT